MHAVVSAGANAGSKKASADSTVRGVSVAQKKICNKKEISLPEDRLRMPGNVTFPTSG